MLTSRNCEGIESMVLRKLPWLQRLVDKSVFKSLPITPNGSGNSMNDILAVLFHRATATMYLIYSVWATISIVVGIPTLADIQGSEWQIYFSLSVLLTTAPAGLGATFWPAMARTELFAGSSFVAGMLIYLFFSFQRAISGEGSWAGAVILISIIVIPLARTAVITIFLMVQAKAAKATKKMIEGGTRVSRLSA